MSTTDKEYLEKIRKYATEVRMFLGNKMKPERERSVCRAFLRALGISLQENEIVAPANNEPVDVMFRDARFQIRDILESDHRRGDIWKDKQRKFGTATSIDEAIETDRPIMPSPVDINALIPEVTTALSKKANKYGITCQYLDMLIYLDLRKRFLAAGSTELRAEPLKAQGWRSVSLLFPPYGVVLFAKPEAPDFLKAAETGLHMQWPDIDTLFQPMNCGC